MARRFSMAFLAAVAIAALIQSSAAQTTYTVGDTTGWTIPPGGSAFYSSWAANKTFNVGDILVFNFMNNQHDVAKVTKTEYDACTANTPITLVRASPARITINASGDHYFLCTFAGGSHCSSGQKLMINVSAATAPTPPPTSQPSSPAPQPSSPSPRPSSPAPQPTTPTPASSPSPVSTPPLTPATTPSSSPPEPSTATPPSTSTTPPPSTTATSPSGVTAPPPPNSASSVCVAGLFTTCLSIFVALLY